MQDEDQKDAFASEGAIGNRVEGPKAEIPSLWEERTKHQGDPQGNHD